MLPKVWVCLLCVVWVCVCGGWGAPAEDEVGDLPGIQFQVDFRHYSGYLDGGFRNALHYWFVESQRDPKKDPLVLWLNGGPGCSSLIGMLTENGPFRLDLEGDKLWEHIYSWNKVANVLYLESPGGVGFSYVIDGNGNEQKPGDNLTAEINYRALLHFFDKFGEFNGTDLYITGESYAGTYIPLLANKLINNTEFPAPLKGVAIGNGFFSMREIMNSYPAFLYNHGLIGDKIWFPLMYECCNGSIFCDFMPYYMNTTVNNTRCVNLTYAASQLPEGLDPFNLYYTCYDRSGSLLHSHAGKQLPEKMGAPMLDRSIRDGHLAGMNFLLGSSLGVEGGLWNAGPPQYEHCRPPYDNFTSIYLNRDDVKAALHIPTKFPQQLPPWSPCNEQIKKEWEFEYEDMSSEILSLVKAKVRVLLYNGDVDSVCNVIANERFADHLRLKEVQSRRPWHYRKEVPSVAGYYKRMEGLDFVTVRGAGHFVPNSKPRESLQMIANFFINMDYDLPVSIPVSPAPPPVTGSHNGTNTTTMTTSPSTTTTKKAANALTPALLFPLLLLTPLLPLRNLFP